MRMKIAGKFGVEDLDTHMHMGRRVSRSCRVLEVRIMWVMCVDRDMTQIICTVEGRRQSSSLRPVCTSREKEHEWIGRISSDTLKSMLKVSG